jgi:hypothetical protein
MSSVTEIVASGITGWASSSRTTSMDRRSVWTDFHRPQRRELAGGEGGDAGLDVAEVVRVAAKGRRELRDGREVLREQVEVDGDHRLGDRPDGLLQLIGGGADRLSLADRLPRPVHAVEHILQGGAQRDSIPGQRAGRPGDHTARAPQSGEHPALDLVHVAGDAQLHKRLAPQHGVRAAEERRVPAVLALLDGTVEQGRLAPERVARADVAEVLRRLHQRDALILEVGERVVEDPRVGHLVRIEDQDELAAGRHQGAVEVAGLGVQRLAIPRAAAGQIADPERGDRVGELRPCAVVEDPGGVGVVDRPSGAHRVQDQLDVLVVGRDEDIDVQVGAGTGGRGRCRARHTVIPNIRTSMRL